MKLIPVAGSVFAVGLAGYEIKKKGLIPGVAHVGLDVIPVVGATKNVIEIFTGDLIPDKKVPTLEKVQPANIAAHRTPCLRKWTLIEPDENPDGRKIDRPDGELRR
jgi:hypothetical protein